MPDPQRQHRPAPSALAALRREDALPLRFSCAVPHQGEAAAWMTIEGELDLAVVDELEDALRDALDANRLVVLDLAALTFVDLAGIRAIAEATGRAARRERRLVLVFVPEHARRLIAVSGAEAAVDVLDVPVPRRPSGPANPHTVRVIGGVVAAVDAREVVLADEADAAIAAVPVPTTFAVEAGTPVRAYVAADGRLNGWMPAGGTYGANLRRWAPEAGYAPVPAECFGPCGIVWEAPAAEQLTDHGEGCLECNGSLEVRPRGA